MPALVITNLTPLRTINASSASPKETLRLLGTVADDWQNGVYDGSAYLITDLAELRTYDVSSIAWSQVVRVLASLITRNPGSSLDARGFVVANPTTQFPLNVASASLNEADSTLIVPVLFTAMPNSVVSVPPDFFNVPWLLNTADEASGTFRGQSLSV